MLTPKLHLVGICVHRELSRSQLPSVILRRYKLVAEEGDVSIFEVGDTNQSENIYFPELDTVKVVTFWSSISV